MNDFDGLSDHFVLRMYEFIHDQVLADVSAGARLVGLPARRSAATMCGIAGAFTANDQMQRLQKAADSCCLDSSILTRGLA